MSGAKHTPGPWTRMIAPKPGFISEIVGPIKSGVGGIALVGYIPPGWGDAEANARLIAAAPDLLAVLREISEDAGFWNTRAGWREDVLSRARAAIAKATGEPRP